MTGGVRAGTSSPAITQPTRNRADIANVWMNTVLRTLGGALGGQLAATFVAASTAGGLPALTGFTQTFAMSALFLVGCVLAGLLVPARTPPGTSLQPAASSEPV